MARTRLDLAALAHARGDKKKACEQLRQARTALRVSTSATASWKEAATSATGTSSPAARRASTQRATAVFSPEKEKS